MSSILPEGSDSKTSHSPEPCACGHDETDHGGSAGCIHCGRCWEYEPRSSYVSVELDDDEPDCGHHSWAGLMALLDEHWPDDIFPTRYEDDPKRDAGARSVSTMRWVDQLRATDVILRAELIKSIEANNTWRERLMHVEALTYASDDGTEYEHNGHGIADGEPECPGCWVSGIRGALGGEA